MGDGWDDLERRMWRDLDDAMRATEPDWDKLFDDKPLKIRRVSRKNKLKEVVL